MSRDFERQLHERAQRLAENARLREQHLRDLKALLEAEVQRERELKQEEAALGALQQNVERWKQTVKTADGDMQERTKLLQESEESLLSNLSVVNRMRRSEEELMQTLTTQLSGRRDSLQKEKLRLAHEHYDLGSYELKALTRKGDRLRRRGEILEQKRADCYFTMEMAFENETPVDEVRQAQHDAARYANEANKVRDELEKLAHLANTVDNQDLQNTMRLLGREHPQREIRGELQRERRAYQEKLRERLKQEESALCDGTVQYIHRVSDPSVSDGHDRDAMNAKAAAMHPAVFSPISTRALQIARNSTPGGPGPAPAYPPNGDSGY